MKVSHLHSNLSASGRTHDARHTAATVLLPLGVPERAAMGVTRWSHGSMAKRYQHVTAIACGRSNSLWHGRTPRP